MYREWPTDAIWRVDLQRARVVPSRRLLVWRGGDVFGRKARLTRCAAKAALAWEIDLSTLETAGCGEKAVSLTPCGARDTLHHAQKIEFEILGLCGITFNLAGSRGAAAPPAWANSLDTARSKEET